MKTKFKKFIGLATEETKKSDKNSLFSRFIAFFRMSKAVLTKEYKGIKTETIVVFVFTVFYILFPMDLITDLIPVVGILDDLTVFGFFVSRLNIEIDAFIRWESERTEKEIIVEG